MDSSARSSAGGACGRPGVEPIGQPLEALTGAVVVPVNAMCTQSEIRYYMQDSGARVAMVAQELLPRRDGQGRVAAHEVLIGTPAVRNLIREQKGTQLVSAMQTGQQFGMQTMAQSLEQLTRAGLI